MNVQEVPKQHKNRRNKNKTYGKNAQNMIH
jgi:hypothetical protein